MTGSDSAPRPTGMLLTEEDTFDIGLETASGSRYHVTWDAEGHRGTLTRTTSTSPVDHPMSQPLRRDGETLVLLGFDRIDLGYPTTFVIDVRGDGIPTIRCPSPSIAITGTAWSPASHIAALQKDQ